jgi:hypothetical protein
MCSRRLSGGVRRSTRGCRGASWTLWTRVRAGKEVLICLRLPAGLVRHILYPGRQTAVQARANFKDTKAAGHKTDGFAFVPYVPCSWPTPPARSRHVCG